jgi:hypothetical protein
MQNGRLVPLVSLGPLDLLGENRTKFCTMALSARRKWVPPMDAEKEKLPRELDFSNFSSESEDQPATASPFA